MSFISLSSITNNLGHIPYLAGKYENFIKKLDDPFKIYTFFVPRDVAWTYLRRENPKLYETIMSEPGKVYEVSYCRQYNYYYQPVTASLLSVEKAVASFEGNCSLIVRRLVRSAATVISTAVHYSG